MGGTNLYQYVPNPTGWVDPTISDTSYEFPPDWADLFEEYGKNAKVDK